MNTALALLARFQSPTVKLEDICREYFGLDQYIAYQKAALNELPVPTFRAAESHKAPRLVHLEDLAQWLDASRIGLATSGPESSAVLPVTATREMIVSAAQPARGPAGVYFLLNDGQIVYVGQSRHIARRLHAHRRAKRAFQSYAWIPVASLEQRLELERRYIRALSPAWNIAARLPEEHSVPA